MYYHTEITIGFDGMEFLYGLTILFFIPFHLLDGMELSGGTEPSSIPYVCVSVRVCVCVSVCLEIMALELAPKLLDRFRSNFGWRFGQVCFRLTTTQSARSALRCARSAQKYF